MLSTVVLFLIVLIGLGFAVIRWVPLNCRMLIKRRSSSIVLMPGINFLIPFVDKVLVYARTYYDQVRICDFWIADTHFELIASFGLKDQDSFVPEDAELLFHFPKKAGTVLQELLETEGSDDNFDRTSVLKELEDRLAKEYATANISFKLSSIRVIYEEPNNQS